MNENDMVEDKNIMESILTKQALRQMVLEKKLIEAYVDLDTQLTPNGFDLTAGKIFSFDAQGSLDFSNTKRIIPQGKELLPQKDSSDKCGWWTLTKGIYKVRTNEIVNLPNNLMAIAFSRTSLLRMGAFTENGVWDAGFSGRGEFVLVVENPFGIKVQENARLVQMVFLPIKETEKYSGVYRGLR